MTLDHTALDTLLKRYNRPGPRYTSYPTALQFSPGFTAQSYLEHLQADTSTEPLSLYIHLPFCDARCLFCACNTIISPDHAKVDWYVDALLAEIDMVRAALGHARPAAQLHLGGGTPTYFSPEQLERIVTHVLSAFPPTPDAELSIEVDPRVTSDAHLERLAALGFNRISLGVQDLDPVVQEAIHRVQPFELVEHITAKARALGFRSVNVDLIYGLPGQTTASFEDTVRRVITLRPDRLAIYGFAFLPGAKGHHRKLDRAALPDADARFQLASAARALLTEAGWVDIGMDHFALPDDELALAQRDGRLARNFMGYTVAHTREILAFGTSAIGFFGGAYVQNAHKLSAWRDAIAQGRLPTDRGLQLDEDDLRRKAIIDDIMCNFQVDASTFQQRWKAPFRDAFGPELEALRPLADDGLVLVDDGRLRVTPLGRHFVRNVAMAFDRYNKPTDAAPFSQTV